MYFILQLNYFLFLAKKEKSEPDLVGYIMMLVIWSIAVYPLLLVSGAMLLNLDPFYHILILLQQTIPIFSLPWVIILHTIRLIILCIGFAEIYRVVELIFIIFISGVRTMNRILKYIHTITNQRGIFCLPQMIKMHTQLELAIRLIALFQEGGTLISLSAGGLYGIFCMYFTIKGYVVFPFYFYILFPSISIFVICTFSIIFNMAIDVLEKSIELRRIWPLVWFKSRWAIVVRKQKKEMRKLLRSIRPVRLNVGIGEFRFFIVKRNTKITYFFMIITHTINLLLCIPQDLVDEFAVFIST
jgi:hypothetical protein